MQTRERHTIDCPGCGRSIRTSKPTTPDGWLLASQWCTSCGGSARPHLMGERPQTQGANHYTRRTHVQP